jgi:hypothetical protein
MAVRDPEGNVIMHFIKRCAVCRGFFRPHPRAARSETRTLCLKCRKVLRT